jgi:hypothetical protein
MIESNGVVSERNIEGKHRESKLDICILSSYVETKDAIRTSISAWSAVL